MSEMKSQEARFPVRLTEAQRKVVAEILPKFSDRLRLNEPAMRPVDLSLTEMKSIHDVVRAAIARQQSGMKRNSLRHAAAFLQEAMESFQGIGAIPSKERIYQFKITLMDCKPPIWRRIQTKDCTLDKLHDQIQTAMGWTNSHLHHFMIGETRFGDPALLEEDFEEMNYQSTLDTRISQIVPRSGKRFAFEYEYDFGDSWHHEVLFEGCLRAQPGEQYPLCVEGERACPPEDVGGTPGYKGFLVSLADPEDERHEERLVWIGGAFDAEAFDSELATKRMRRGLPAWWK